MELKRYLVRCHYGKGIGTFKKHFCAETPEAAKQMMLNYSPYHYNRANRISAKQVIITNPTT